MNALVEEKLPEMRNLCVKHGVRKLSVFGSVTSDEFDPARSDVDVLVEFEPMAPEGHAAAYFRLAGELEGLFGRHVDLVERVAIRNKYLLAAMRRSESVVYDVS